MTMSAERKMAQSSPLSTTRAQTVTGSTIPCEMRMWNCPGMLTGSVVETSRMAQPIFTSFTLTPLIQDSEFWILDSEF